MGRPKLDLLLAGLPVIEWTIQAFRQAGVERIVVVLGPQGENLVPLVKQAGAYPHVLAMATPDMRATVEQGLDWIEGQFRPVPSAIWFLCPADQPGLPAAAIRKLQGEFERQPSASAAVPTYGGRRGHPAILRWDQTAAIQSLPPDVGINRYFRELGPRLLEVPLADEGILTDLDTPEDYQRLQAAFANRLIHLHEGKAPGSH